MFKSIVSQIRQQVIPTFADLFLWFVAFVGHLLRLPLHYHNETKRLQQDIDTLRETIAAHQAEAAEIVREKDERINALEEELQQKEVDLNDCYDGKNEFEIQITDANERNRTLEKRLIDLEANLTNISIERDDLRDTVKKSQGCIRELHTCIEQLKDWNTELKIKKCQVEEEMTSTKERMSSAEARLEETVRELHEVTSAFSEQQQLREESEGIIMKFREEKQEILEQVETLRVELTRTQTSRDAFEHKHEELLRQMTEYLNIETTLQEANIEKAELEQKLENLRETEERTTETHSEEKESWKSEIRTLRSQIETLEENFRSSEERAEEAIDKADWATGRQQRTEREAEELRRSVQNKVVELEQVQQKLKDMEREHDTTVNNLNSLLNIEKRETERLTVERDETREIHRDDQIKIKELDTRINVLQRESDAFKAKTERLERELDGKTRETAGMQSRLVVLEAERDRLKQDLRRQEESFEQKQRELQVVQHDLFEAFECKSSLEEELRRTKDLLRAEQSEYLQLQTRYDRVVLESSTVKEKAAASKKEVTRLIQELQRKIEAIMEALTAISAEAQSIDRKIADTFEQVKECQLQLNNLAECSAESEETATSLQDTYRRPGNQPRTPREDPNEMLKHRQKTVSDEEVSPLPSKLIAQNCVNGTPVKDAQVKVYDKDQRLKLQTTTDETGEVVVSGLPPAIYRIHIKGEKYSDNAGLFRVPEKADEEGESDDSGKQEIAPLALNPKIDEICLTCLKTENKRIPAKDCHESGHVFVSPRRIVLSWDREPRDLDSHLEWYDEEGKHRHVYFAKKDYFAEGDRTAWLDVDVTTGFGPETLSLDIMHEGTSYVYYVHLYAGEGQLTDSQALVKLYDVDDLMYPPFEVPKTGEGRYWHVFDIDGSTGELTIVNQIMKNAPRKSGL